MNYLVCANVNMNFSDHMGVEIFYSLFGTLHSYFCELSQENFPYERRPQSQAHIPEDEGDFYYTGALFGGSMPEAYKLTKACHEMMVINQASHIEAMQNDENHLNEYPLYTTNPPRSSPLSTCGLNRNQRVSGMSKSQACLTT